VQLASIGCECDTDSQFVRKKRDKRRKKGREKESAEITSKKEDKRW